MRDVVITGIGPVLPNCDHRERLWAHLRDGASQLRMEPDPSDASVSWPMGRISDFEPERYLHELPDRLYAKLHREQHLYLASLLLARDDAHVNLDAVPRDRVGLFDGTSRGNFAYWYDLVRREATESLEQLYTKHELMVGMHGQAVGLAAALLGIRGPAYTFGGTCSAGSIAIGHAYREVRAGEVDVAFATGHDAALVAPVFQMYRSTGLLSQEREDPRRAVRPFVGHSGNAFGEGAVTLVLESLSHAKRRGARILAYLSGYRYGNGGEHPTAVDRTGARPALLISSLLEENRLTPDDVHFVVGHGNGVRLSDESELRYMRLVFGGDARRTPLLSTKPIYGHTLGASGAVSAAAAVLMLHHQHVIPTINVDEALVAEGMSHQCNRGRDAACETGVVVAFGIGGQNSVLLFRKAPGDRSRL